MNINDYIRHLESVINGCPVITAYVLNIDRRTEEIAFIYGTMEFRDGSVLDFKEFIEHRETTEKFKYAYNYRLPQDFLFRYDNAADPAARELPSFPHHKHQQDGKIVESFPVALNDILSIIEDMSLSK